MTRDYFYLTIPPGHARFLGGLRWAVDAIVEEEDGATFVLNAEVAAFLEGVVGSGPPFHFGPLLQLLHLLGRGKKAPPAWARELRATFVRSGKSLGNAGAFFGAALPVPRVAGPLDVGAVLRRLRGLPAREDLALPGAIDEESPLGPEELELAVKNALAEQPPGAVEHWFRTGRAPIDAGRVVETVEQIPRSLDGVLASLLRRPRLAGAAPFVGPLVSALALPRRELAHQELPLGGYVDVTTRGGFDQILVSQLVLDDIEFVRRFAANELLYYRREEPHRENREELVLLLDQGARTWGFVRIVLAAACVALGKQAARKKLPLLVATTAPGSRLVDPLRVEEGVLADLAEGSDFSADPALALEALLEAPSEPGRDVVLLTHARSVAHPDVLAAARRLRPGARLFAVGVAGDGADDGAVTLSEIRHGAPVVRTRCRVSEESLAPPAPERALPLTAPGPHHPWRGDVEAIGFPFRFGLTGGAPRFFDFDATGAWVLVSARLGTLHAARTDGSRFEIVPRGVVAGHTIAEGGAPLEDVAAIHGTTDGFVVTGTIAGRLPVAVHYDFSRRTVKTHVLAPPMRVHLYRWAYFPELRSVVTQRTDDPAACWAVDLDAGKVSTRSQTARARVLEGAKGADQRVPLELDASGRVTVPGQPGWLSFMPLADGKPELAGFTAGEARLAGATLAFFTPPQGKTPVGKLRLFRGPTGAPVDVLTAKPTTRFALSHDGAFLALETGSARVEVRETVHAGSAFAFPKGRFHSDVKVALGAVWLRIYAGGHKHVIQWHEKVLRASLEAVARRSTPGEPAYPLSDRGAMQPRFTRSDSSRFTQSVTVNVTAVVDVFGHVVILDRKGEKLLAVFFAYRRQLAAWMPDGTRFGSTALLDGPPTPGAAERLGQVLFQAGSQGRGEAS